MLVTQRERDAYAQKKAARWFRDDVREGTEQNPFEPVEGLRGYYRIRSRSDGSCGFLSSNNRCRLHEELGAAAKPLTCRMFPFKFSPTPGGVAVTASFGCPTIVDNRGDLAAHGASRAGIEGLVDEWSKAGGRTPPASRSLVAGRSIDGPSLHTLRESLLRMLARADEGVMDLRANVQRIAGVFDDLTRHRVLRLADSDFAEYIKLTLPYAASSTTAIEPRAPGRIGRLMQHGFLYLVAATRYGIEHRNAPAWTMRVARVRMLAHFHGLAPAIDRVNIGALGSQRLDINAPEIQPVVFHYLRAAIDGLGAGQRPVLDDFAIAVSCLNAACSLAIMNAHAAATAIDRQAFSIALMESVDILQADDRGLLGWALPKLAAQVEALRLLSAPARDRD